MCIYVPRGQRVIRRCVVFTVFTANCMFVNSFVNFIFCVGIWGLVIIVIVIVIDSQVKIDGILNDIGRVAV
jgi:hypothetical protein